MSGLLTIGDLQERIPILQDAPKKTPIHPRLEVLETLMNLTNFKSIETFLGIV